MANGSNFLKVCCWRDIIIFCDDKENQFCRLIFQSLPVNIIVYLISFVGYDKDLVNSQLYFFRN